MTIDNNSRDEKIQHNTNRRSKSIDIIIRVKLKYMNILLITVELQNKLNLLILFQEKFLKNK